MHNNPGKTIQPEYVATFPRMLFTGLRKQTYPNNKTRKDAFLNLLDYSRRSNGSYLIENTPFNYTNSGGHNIYGVAYEF
jgi:hypothetical protein